MNRSWILGAALATLTLSGATAQQPNEGKKARKEAAVVDAEKTVASDKADLNALRDRKIDDQLLSDQPAVKADRKAIRKGQRKLLKDQVKKEVTKVKKAL